MPKYINYNSLFSKIWKGYKSLAITITSSIVVLVIINVLAFVLHMKNNKIVFEDYHRQLNFNVFDIGSDQFLEDSLETIELIKEYISYLNKHKTEFEYHYATEFQHKPISLSGFEIIADSTMPFTFRSNGENKNETQGQSLVYCFGGSTTLGALVSNGRTWPAFLQNEILQSQSNYKVFNFGVAGFTPTQETAQFIELIKTGNVPDVVVFMDGLNVQAKNGGSDFSYRNSEIFNSKSAWSDVISCLPVMRMIAQNNVEEGRILLESNGNFNGEIVHSIIENGKLRKAIAEEYGIELYQFLQPIAWVNYDFAYSSVAGKLIQENNQDNLIKKNYEEIYKEIKKQSSYFIDFSNLNKAYNRPAYIDLTHYSPGFNEFVARKVWGILNNRGSIMDKDSTDI